MNDKLDQFIITPTEHGVRVVVNGVSFFRPCSKSLLAEIGKLFLNAAQTSHSKRVRT